MNFLSLVGVELKKIRRSKILLILLIPVIMMWIPSIINADMNFDLRGIPITPENNFFIQGFMGMVWFMIPASLVICTVLLNQTERSNKGILKMLSLPISTTKLCLAKFTVLILLAAFQMVMSIGAYYICAAIVTHTQDYNFILEPLYVCKNVCSIYAAAIPMAAVYLAVSTLIQSPIFSVGIGLASIVPSVLMINTKIWFAYPMSYPFYLIMVAYGRAAEGVYETQIAWLPWLPVAVGITILALVVSCMRYGASTTLFQMIRSKVFISDCMVFFDTIATFVQTIAGGIIPAAKNMAQISNGISNPVVAGIVYWLIRILICGGCLVGAGIFLAFIGIKIVGLYKKYCWDMITIMVILISMATAIYFGNWIKTVLPINLLFFLLLPKVR